MGIELSAFFVLRLSFVLLKDRSSFFPENSGGFPCSAIDEFLPLEKKNDILRKGCHEVSGFQLFQFCSKPRGPTPAFLFPSEAPPELNA